MPVLLSANAERGVLCARISCVTVRDLVEKRRTSPVGCCDEGALEAELEVVVERGVGIGKGEG